MGIWTTFTGTITTHKSDNFSAKKALEAYLGNKHLLAKDSKFTYTRGHSVLNNYFKGVK